MVYAKICDKMYLHRYKMTIEVEMHILWYNEPGFTAHYFTFVSGAFYVNSASLNILRAPGCGFGERWRQLKCSWVTYKQGDRERAQEIETLKFCEKGWYKVDSGSKTWAADNNHC